MPLRTNAVLTFAGYQALPTVPVTVELRFTCADPGPNMEGGYMVTVTDAELTAATTGPLLKQLLLDKLKLQFKPLSVNAARLDGLIGQTVTV